MSKPVPNHRHIGADPATYTHAFCLTKTAWNIIRNYAIEQQLSYSAALREILLIGWETIKRNRSGQ